MEVVAPRTARVPAMDVAGGPLLVPVGPAIPLAGVRPQAMEGGLRGAPVHGPEGVAP